MVFLKYTIKQIIFRFIGDIILKFFSVKKARKRIPRSDCRISESFCAKFIRIATR